MNKVLQDFCPNRAALLRVELNRKEIVLLKRRAEWKRIVANSSSIGTNGGIIGVDKIEMLFLQGGIEEVAFNPEMVFHPMCGIFMDGSKSG